ncbi:MAG: 16S rRNA (cytidine(1402)-2'-O)-methyltransferase [Gemmatimonadota bacterium]|nr:MAG: 16S rRNA (cytidine(1402)-2'-O)-methyltransferase [Gemmatimonadota bacterium]
MAGTLYVVATPLGNLSDLSQRAGEVLRSAQLVAAEDTRRARTLLAHVGAKPRVFSYHAHSSERRLRELVSELESGTDVILITDAGTPAISDPGRELVSKARASGARVVPIPGPSAVATALSASGLPADKYTFLGFLPRKGKERRLRLQEIAASPWTVVVFEAANRLVRLLTDLTAHCGAERGAVVARELTKLHEEIRPGNLDELRVYYEEREPRGEVTVLISAAPRETTEFDAASVELRARVLLQEGVTRRDVADQLAEEFSMPRRDAYRLVTGL